MRYPRSLQAQPIGKETLSEYWVLLECFKRPLSTLHFCMLRNNQRLCLLATTDLSRGRFYSLTREIIKPDFVENTLLITLVHNTFNYLDSSIHCNTLMISIQERKLSLLSTQSL